MDEEKPQTLTEKIMAVNHEINDAFREATMLGQDERVAEICDEYGQFMCEVGQAMLGRAKAVEQLSSKYPECKTELSELARNFRNSAQNYFNLYSSFEKLQRTGKVPTSLPDLI